MNDMKQKDDTMRATPETDAASNELGMYGNIVAVNFARSLERQRDEAREELKDVLSDTTYYIRKEAVELADHEKYQYRELARELVVRIEQMLLCKSGPYGWIAGNLSIASKQAENSMIKAKEVLGEA